MYTTVADFRAYAKAGGVDLDAKTDDDLMAMLVQATRFIDSLDSKLRGKRTVQTQPHAYPRRNLTIYGEPWPADVVPNIVVDLQHALALEVYEGIDIFGAMTEQAVVKERVDVIEVQYATSSSASADGNVEERESLAMALLRELMDTETGGGIGFLKVVRT
jgi:hypothetical protein